MEINWSTFVFEIINFLVLVWILKRFLYQPVLAIINRRREAIAQQMESARQQQADAGKLKQQYERQLADLEHERRNAMEKLKHEIEELRAQQLEKLKSELAAQDEKTRVARERQDRRLKREIEQFALQQGAEFAARLLAVAAGPELENRLFEILLNALNNLSEDQLKALTNKWGDTPEHILVTSTYPLTDSNRRRLEDALGRITGQTAEAQYKQDAKLLAGLNISVGSWLLQLNVRDELRGFAELDDVEH